MNSDEFESRVRSGRLPTGPNDLGPHTSKVADVLVFLKSGQLLRFGGRLGVQFIPITDLKQATALAHGANEVGFNWREDCCAVWDMPKPLNVFGDVVVMQAYKSNLARLDSSVDQELARSIPQELRDIAYDIVYNDFIQFAKGFALFGRLDCFYGLMYEAYRQGAWPCGCTGTRPGEMGLENLDGRKMLVYWGGDQAGALVQRIV
jgi:hypothetical protein